MRRRTPVAVLLAGDDVVLRERVPKRWLDHVENVLAVRRRLGSITGEYENVLGLKVTDSTNEYGGRRGLELTVELTEPDGELDLPDSIDGITIGTEKAIDRGLSACYNDGAFDPVPGGVVVEAGENGVRGTACCRVRRDGDEQLLTAAHLWGGCRDPVDAAVPAYQSGRRLGVVDRFDVGTDVAFVAPDGDVSLDDSIATVGDRLPVGGVVSHRGLAVLLTADEQVYNVGTSSGYTAGQITAIAVEEGWNNCITFGGHGVEAEHRNVEGDSGGPVFYHHDGKAFLASIQSMWLNRVGVDCSENIAGDRGRGTAAAHVREKFGVEFAG